MQRPYSPASSVVFEINTKTQLFWRSKDATVKITPDGILARNAHTFTGWVKWFNLKFILNVFVKLVLMSRLFYVIFQAKNKTSVPNQSEKSNLRVIWGKVTRTHGNAGSVRAKFAKNLPPNAMGRRVRIMMYPSRI